jgi:hypothetical protein
MNFWRWLGIAIFLLGTVGLIGTTQFSAYGKDKDKAADKEKDKDKAKDKDKVPDKDKAKDKDKVPDKDKDKVPDKDKAKDKDKDKAKEDLSFNAFDPKKGGKKFYQQQYTKTKQEMKVMGQQVVQNQTQTFIIEWTPKDLDKDGNFVVEQRIVGVKMDIDIGGNKISYNSTSPNKQKNPMTDFFEQLTKPENKLTFTIKSDLSEVKSIEGRKEFIKGLSDINPQMKSLLDAILSDKALSKMAEPTWYAYPAGGAIPKDKTWQKKSELDLGPIGKYNTTFDFKYEGQEKDKDNISIKTNLEYTAPTEKSGLPFIIHAAKLSSNNGTGKAVFDRKAGRFASTEITMNLKGTLEIEVGNQRTTVELIQDQTASSTTLDNLPDEWKAGAAK